MPSRAFDRLIGRQSPPLRTGHVDVLAERAVGDDVDGPLLLSASARQQSGAILAATIGVSVGLLGVVLTAMAAVTAFITRDFVAAVGPDLKREMMPFWTTAVVGATSAIVGVATLVAAPTLPWWALAASLAVGLALTTWLLVGTVQLVGLISFFATVRGRLLRSLIEAEALRAHRIKERS